MKNNKVYETSCLSSHANVAFFLLLIVAQFYLKHNHLKKKVAEKIIDIQPNLNVLGKINQVLPVEKGKTTTTTLPSVPF